MRAHTNIENAGMRSLLAWRGYALAGEIPEFGQMMNVYEKKLGQLCSIPPIPALP